MELSWLPGAVEKVLLGAIGGMSAYWLTHRRFLSERRWEKRYDLYCQIFETLNQLGHSLVLLEAALDAGPESRQAPSARAAGEQFEEHLLRLNQYQERLMLLGATRAHHKVMLLYAGLRVFQPDMVTDAATLEGPELEDLQGLVRDCRRDASGHNGALALLARRDLGMAPRIGILRKLALRWKRTRTLRGKRAGRPTRG